MQDFVESLGVNWPECMLYCKTRMLCYPSDMSAWAYSYLFKKERVQMIKKYFKKQN